MDPISLIVAALAAGVSTSLKDTAGEAIKDAYAGLKALLKRKAGDQQLAQSVLDKHEQAPEVWQKPLEHELRDAGAGDDEQIVRAAQKLLELADPDGARAGKYNVTITGGKGIVVGDRATVTMNFDDTD